MPPLERQAMADMRLTMSADPLPSNPGVCSSRHPMGAIDLYSVARYSPYPFILDRPWSRQRAKIKLSNG